MIYHILIFVVGIFLIIAGIMLFLDKISYSLNDNGFLQVFMFVTGFFFVFQTINIIIKSRRFKKDAILTKAQVISVVKIDKEAYLDEYIKELNKEKEEIEVKLKNQNNETLKKEHERISKNIRNLNAKLHAFFRHNEKTINKVEYINKFQIKFDNNIYWTNWTKNLNQNTKIGDNFWIYYNPKNPKKWITKNNVSHYS